MEINTERLKLLPCSEKLMTSVQYEMGPHIQIHLSKLRIDSSQFGWGPWLIIHKETRKVIGDIGFKGKPNNRNTVEIGYGILPALQNNGFATEAGKAIVNWAVSHHDVNTVIAECLNDNFASINVLKKLGMTIVGKEESMLKWKLHNDEGTSPY